MEKEQKHQDFGISRRTLGLGALAGGASIALGMAGVARGETGGTGVLLDARKAGAKGDGKTDDTRAIQRAVDTAAEHEGAVFFPPGSYLSSEIRLRPGVALAGVPSWNYHTGGGTTVKLIDPKASCLLNITGAAGATVDGLALDGDNLGKGIHGIFLNKPDYGRHEDCFRIERSQVLRFTGDGLNLTRAWCFSVRHSMLAYNHGDGLRLRGWDGFLIDNWFSGNRRAGFAAREENSSVTMTGNRIEWNNEGNILILGGSSYNITGNYLDRAGAAGIALLTRNGGGLCQQMTLTGNYVYRSGKSAAAGTHESSQIRIHGGQGITCVGNAVHVGRDDGGKGTWSPSYGIVYGNLTNCVIANNVLHEGATVQPMVDLGGHGEGAIVRDNPGSVFKAHG